MTAEEAKKLTKETRDRALVYEKEKTLGAINLMAQMGRTFTFQSVFIANREAFLQWLEELGYKYTPYDIKDDKILIQINW